MYLALTLFICFGLLLSVKFLRLRVSPISLVQFNVSFLNASTACLLVKPTVTTILICTLLSFMHDTYPWSCSTLFDTLTHDTGIADGEFVVSQVIGYQLYLAYYIQINSHFLAFALYICLHITYIYSASLA